MITYPKKVSTIVLSFNRPHLLKKTIDSYLKTTHVPFEMLVVDNNSDTETKSLIQEFASQYPDKIFPILLDQNLGAEAINLVVPKCQGQYIHISENDQEYLPDWFEKAEECLTTFDKLGQICLQSPFPAEEEVWHTKVTTPRTVNGVTIHVARNNSVFTCLLKREALNGFTFSNLKSDNPNIRLPSDGMLSRHVKKQGFICAYAHKHLVNNLGHYATEISQDYQYYSDCYTVKFGSDEFIRHRLHLKESNHPSPKAFVFIAGLNRSGTSLLHRLLRGNPQISGFTNTGAIQDEGQHLQDVYPIQKVHGGAGRFAFHPEAHLDETSQLITPANITRLYESWAKHWDFSKPFVIEKSPSNLIRMRFLQAMFPYSMFIVLIRHPLAVGYATQKWSKTTIRELVEHWVVAHQTMLDDLKQVKKYIILRYEDFVERPTETMHILENWIGANPSPLNEPVESDVNRKYFEMWEKEIQADPMTLRRVRLLRHLPNSFGYFFMPPYIKPSRFPITPL